MTKSASKFLLIALSLVFMFTGNAYAEPATPHSESSHSTQASLFTIINSDSRPDSQRSRDKYRHPLQSLTFFGIEPFMTVVEIWPGGQGGFYRRIISPLLDGTGEYLPVTSNSEFPTSIKPTRADMVLVFRAHGFMIYEIPAQDHYHALFNMLKPGGIFGIVDHRGDEMTPQDPAGENGYVNQSHVIQLAENAGFVLLASSEINANPKDTKNHPDGLYSLPPTLRGTTFNRTARKHFLDIGESDRMTLKFARPLI